METKLIDMFFAAVTVIGLIQWGKSLAGAIRTGGWAWATPGAIPFVSFVVALVGGGGVNVVLTNTGIIWALVQLCWDLILRGLYAIFNALVQRLTDQPGKGGS